MPDLDTALLTPDEQSEYLAILEVNRRVAAKNDLIEYAKYIDIPGVPVVASTASDDDEVDPETGLRTKKSKSDNGTEKFYPDSVVPALHHELIMRTLMRVEKGEIQKLMILAPPGSSKSTYASVVYPTWLMGKNPNIQIIKATYGDSLARKFGRKCRSVCKSDKYKEVFDSSLSPGNGAADAWSVTNGSAYMCGGILSGMTGNRCDCLLGDTKIITNLGEKSIKDIVNGAETCYVLSYDEKTKKEDFRKVVASATKEVADYYRICTSDGRVVEATGNHRFHTQRGYIRAEMLSPGDNLLQTMLQGDYSAILRCAEEAKNGKQKYILLAKLHVYFCQHIKGNIAPGLQRVRDIIEISKISWDSSCAKILLRRVQNKKLEGYLEKLRKCFKTSALRVLQQSIFAKDDQDSGEVLQPKVQRWWPCKGNDGEWKSRLATWCLSIKKATTQRQNISRYEAGNIAQRFLSMCGLLYKRASTYPSYEYECLGQSLDESGDNVQSMSYKMARRGTVKAQGVSVALVERIHKPATVFDIQVEGTECFFANGILVHNCLIIDDPIKNKAEADSPTVQERTWEEYKSSLRTRVKPNGKQVIINTRWHLNDLSGHILPDDYAGQTGWIKSKDGEDWYVLCITAECVREDDPLGRKIGEFLWTDWFSVKFWQNEKRIQGERNWNALYQQTPIPDGGSIFKRDWFRLLPANREIPHLVFIVQSYDTALTKDSANDPTACTVWGVFKRAGLEDKDKWEYCVLLLDAWEKYLEYPVLRYTIKDDYKATYGKQKKRVNLLLIEEKGSGQSVIQDLRLAGLPIRGYNPGKASKTTRAHIASPIVESGRVYLPESANEQGEVAEWAKPFFKQICSFPHAPHDDYTDTMTQLLIFLEHQDFLTLSSVDVNDPDEPEYAVEDKTDSEVSIYG